MLLHLLFEVNTSETVTIIASTCYLRASLWTCQLVNLPARDSTVGVIHDKYESRDTCLTTDTVPTV